MNILFALGLILTYCIASVLGDCYQQFGCTDKKLGKSFKESQSWKPKANRCYTCTCYKQKKFVNACRKEVEYKVTSVKKSAFSSQLMKGLYEEDATLDEEIEISQSEAKTFECPPVRAPTFNYFTWEFEDIKYKNVYYYFNRLQSYCCSRFVTFTNVDPSCKVVKVGRCRSKVVQKKNPKLRCKAPMSLVG